MRANAGQRRKFAQVNQVRLGAYARTTAARISWTSTLDRVPTDLAWSSIGTVAMTPDTTRIAAASTRSFVDVDISTTIRRHKVGSSFLTRRNAYARRSQRSIQKGAICAPATLPTHSVLCSPPAPVDDHTESFLGAGAVTWRLVCEVRGGYVAQFV